MQDTPRAQFGVPTLDTEAGMAHGPLPHSVLRATTVGGGTEDPHGTTPPEPTRCLV